MNPKNDPTHYRLYSNARKKRRASLNGTNKENRLKDELHLIKSVASLKSVIEEADEKPNTKSKRTTFNTNSDNTISKKSSLKLISVQKSFSNNSTSGPHYKAEPDDSSRTSLLDKLSDSASGSDESLAPEQEQNRRNLLYGIDKAQEREKIKILATLLPDEVLRDPLSRKIRSYQVALMFSDVSGFTNLCEKYDKTGMGGPSRLTEVLNEYIGSMINIVLSKNGDVCKFGGDAFLCSWKVTENLDITEVVHLAIESAVDIQKNCGKYKVDVGVKLSVKIAVSAGKVLFSLLGTNTRKQYVIAGPPVMEVKDAEHISKAGDVIVTLSAWKYVKNYMLYSFTYLPDNNYIKVHDFGPLWKSTKENLKHKRGGLMFEELRPFLKYATRLNIEDIGPFILPPVMRNLDANRPLEYLTEMRQIAIVFYNIVPDLYNISSEEIIQLCDSAIQLVSDYVSRSGGVTNKLTLFDKDLVILSVFGLKGFKHELASQVALRCAYSSLIFLKKLNHVISASVGVTTGMAYCGVIGHTLRREYTVMGHPVNLAARLMCSYKNIVSCDRNTFLHSKLESNYFELLEDHDLKGIQTSGPFYKFTLEKKKKKLKLDHEAYPILGREKEIKQFEWFLKNGIKPKEKNNFLIIYGEARIGKSRLVAKLVSVAEKISSENSNGKKVPLLEIHIIPLAENYFKVTISYSGMRLIFQYLLELGDSSSAGERADKIILKLGDTKYFHHLASLNSIFKVNFPLQPQYLALSNQAQADVQKALVKELYSKCSPKAEKWLLAIEDAEFMDEESWKLLKLCSDESDKILYLLTIGQRIQLSNAAVNCIKHINATKIKLTEIDKWFYSALACQILGVKAIPVELESFLQNYKSSGNPGWLESFLISLKQSGSIYIGNASSQEIKAMGLVLVPNLMLESKDISSKEGSSQWKNYLETFEDMSKGDRLKVPVCLLGSNFHALTTDQTELTMDVMLLKTFDTLKPLQQLVLKVGSVLGNNLKRNALKFVIHKELLVEERPFAKAIKSLFEIKILICAKGNLTQTNILVPKKMILVSSIQKEVTCECTGLVIPESCSDLPKYANCAYMQFRSSSFKDTIYNLLLNDQKKKYHSSCIEFLIKNTLKCSSCNNAPLTNVIGYEENDKVTLACTVTPIHGVRSTKLEPKSSYLLPSKKPKKSKKNSSYPKRESELVTISDKGDCQCAEILCSVYLVLLDHATSSGRKDIKLEVQLEYASVTLTTHNIPLSMQILEEALALVKEMEKTGSHPEICTPYVYSKIYALMGATKLNMGRLDDSLELLKTSLRYLRANFPRVQFGVTLLNFIQSVKLKMKTEVFPRKLVGKASDKAAPLLDLLSECLGLISIVHMYKRKILMAKYASLRALNKALESNRNFFGLCTAYRTMIDVAYLNSDLKTCAKLEHSAISLCKRCSDKIIEIYEWEAICQLYTVIFQTRYVRAEMEDAVVIGFQSIRIASVIRNTNLKLGLIPELILVLVQLNRLSEAVALLRELEFLSELDTDKSSRLWYYTLCLDFHLYTGFMIVPYEICEYFLSEGDDLSVVRDPDAKYRLYTSLWLWCVRTNEWELSKSYAKTLENYDILNRRETLSNVFTRLKRLEGFLITLVHRMDLRSFNSINSIYLEIHNLMRRLEKDIKIVKVCEPRYRVLKCYYKQIRYRDENYISKLNSAQLEAEAMKDLNLCHWIEHLKMVWDQAISSFQRDFWIEHSRRNQLEWHESEQADQKAIMYSLPLPKF